MKVRPEDLTSRIDKLLLSQKAFEKEIEKLKSELAQGSASSAMNDIQTIHGIPVLINKVQADSPAILRDMADQFKDKIKSGVIVLGSESAGKVFLVALVTKEWTKRFHAGSIVKEISAVVGGSGGGRPDMAQAGGTQPDRLDEALNRVFDIIQRG